MYMHMYALACYNKYKKTSHLYCNNTKKSKQVRAVDTNMVHVSYSLFAMHSRSNPCGISAVRVVTHHPCMHACTYYPLAVAKARALLQAQA